MTTYTYRCPKCGHVFDITRRFGCAPSKTPCEACGKDASRHFPAEGGKSNWRGASR